MVNEPSSTAATPSSAATETGRTTVDELIEARAEIERFPAKSTTSNRSTKPRSSRGDLLKEQLAESNLALQKT